MYTGFIVVHLDDNNSHNMPSTGTGSSSGNRSHLLSGHFLLTGILKEQLEDRVDQTRDVHLELIAHGNHYLLNE